MLLRHILKAWALEHTTAYTLTETAFAVTFIVMRTAGGLMLDINVWRAPVNIFAKLNVSILFGISLYWCSIILALYVKKQREAGRQLTGGMYLLSRGTDWLKRHSEVFLGLMLALAIVVPVWLQVGMGLGYRHIRYGAFIIA